MVNMIAIQRQYESNQKVITTFDESLDIAVNHFHIVRAAGTRDIQRSLCCGGVGSRSGISRSRTFEDGDFVLDENRRRIKLDPNDKQISTNTNGEIYQNGAPVATIGSCSSLRLAVASSSRAASSACCAASSCCCAVRTAASSSSTLSEPPARAIFNGEIYQNGAPVATIGVVDFEDYDNLQHFGENFFHRPARSQGHYLSP